MINDNVHLIADNDELHEMKGVDMQIAIDIIDFKCFKMKTNSGFLWTLNDYELTMDRYVMRLLVSWKSIDHSTAFGCFHYDLDDGVFIHCRKMRVTATDDFHKTQRLKNKPIAMCILCL